MQNLFNQSYSKMSLPFKRVHNRFGGMAGSAVYDGRDTGYMIPGKRDTG